MTNEADTAASASDIALDEAPSSTPDEASNQASASSKRVKVVSTILIFGALALQLWQIISPIPPFLQPIAKITAVVLVIHAVEGFLSAALILRYRLSTSTSNSPTANQSNLLTQKLPASTPLAVLKAGLYAFFVGTVGLLEVVDATKSAATST